MQIVADLYIEQFRIFYAIERKKKEKRSFIFIFLPHRGRSDNFGSTGCVRGARIPVVFWQKSRRESTGNMPSRPTQCHEFIFCQAQKKRCIDSFLVRKRWKNFDKDRSVEFRSTKIAGKSDVDTKYFLKLKLSLGYAQMSQKFVNPFGTFLTLFEKLPVFVGKRERGRGYQTRMKRLVRSRKKSLRKGWEEMNALRDSRP